MKFSYFQTVRSSRGSELTYEKFVELTSLDRVKRICNEVAAEPDHDKQGELKKQLPIVTWQAYFEGKRNAIEAHPSGVFMLDVDGIDNPNALWSSIVARREELGILLAHETPSLHGLRLVAKCRKEYSTIEECQRWLAGEIGLEKYDEVCKDWARSSFIVPFEYFFYIDGKLWTDEPEVVYSTEAPFQPNVAFEEALHNNNFNYEEPKDCDIDQREGLFGGQDEYRGLKLEDIATEWLRQNGEPEQGERNTKLFKLATRMRYLTDFNEATLLRVMPRYGLGEDEMRQLIHSAVGGARAMDMPRDMKDVLLSLQKQKDLTANGVDDDEPEVVKVDLPPFPPVIRQFVEIAPPDFKQAVALCQLPILGALGSKLRAEYLDGRMHSPSFQVSLEAPQASGKSFMKRIADYELDQIIQHDEEQREKERDYDAKVREMKLLNIKVTPENKDEVLGSRPVTMIRYVPPTISITKLLMRICAARGLHVFSIAEEVDTITKAFKRGTNNFNDLLRIGFDNGIAGQDYASENSFSGIVPVYYNLLTSGTPKAMRRFYPDVEDGLVSRVCFVTLPDQFGKKMPVWGKFTDEQKRIVDVGLVRLNEISIIGDEVQPDHVMKMGWLNKEMEKWVLGQQAEAVKHDDRTRDIFCRRSAVVGFRAGMLAWFLYGEKNTPTIRKNVVRFSLWVADSMLTQHLLRFKVTETGSNINRFEDLLKMLPKEFTRDELEQNIRQAGVNSSVSDVLYKWRLAGFVEVLEKAPGPIGGRARAIRFRKL